MPRHIIETDIKRLPLPCRNLVERTITLANEYDFKIKLLDQKSVNVGNIPCEGYLDGEDKVLAVAIARPVKDWMGVFTHEGCHLDQYVENTRIWKKGERVGDFDEWLNGEVYLTPSTLRRYTRYIQHMELDCEIRTTDKIIEYGLPIDVDNYILQSNAYVWFYQAVRLLKKWHRPGKPPYKNPDVMKKMPKTFKPIEEYQEIVKSIRQCNVVDFTLKIML
jgi:hypothetical protein